MPLLEVLKSVNEVESWLSRFYSETADRLSHDEATELFKQLAARKTRSAIVTAELCTKAECGDNLLDKPTEDDLNFLSALVQSSFFKNAGQFEELTHSSLGTEQLVENALRLERDLMMFYLKFHHASCQAQKPVFSELLHQAQNDLVELTNLRQRLMFPR
jgi:rubrerythrin